MQNMLKLFFFIFGFMLCSSNLQAADYGTFESFYSAGGIGFWGWTFIILGTIAIAAFTYFTFGGGSAAAPAWIAAVGSWIGGTVGLSGIAATNFGLALLGGGPIAAGGLGVAGGIAVLSAAVNFGIETAITYASDKAIEEWNHSKFIEANKKMLTLPLPRNKKGGEAYRTTIEYLQKHYKQGESISNPENQLTIKHAGNNLFIKMSVENDKEYSLKDKTLMALLFFQTNRYSESKEMAYQAMQIANSIGKKNTLSSFIWALSELSDPDRHCTPAIICALEEAYSLEPKNKLIPLMTACCMDRMMYRYHYGQITIDDLYRFCEIITNEKIDKKLAAASIEIVVMRCLIELKRTKQDIHIITKDMAMMSDKRIVAELRKRFLRHEKLITMSRTKLLFQFYRLEEELPAESAITGSALASLLYKYHSDLKELDKKIKYVPHETPLPKVSKLFLWFTEIFKKCSFR